MKKAAKSKSKTKSKTKSAAKPKKKTAVKPKPKAKAKAKAAPKTKPKSKAKPAAKAKAPARPVAKSKAAAPVKSRPVNDKPVVDVRRKAEKKPEVPKEPRNFIPVLPDPIIPKRREEPARRMMQKPLADQDNRNRYSDKELEEFRDLINAKLKEARKELVTLQAAITNANEHGTDDTA